MFSRRSRCTFLNLRWNTTRGFLEFVYFSFAISFLNILKLSKCTDFFSWTWHCKMFLCSSLTKFPSELSLVALGYSSQLSSFNLHIGKVISTIFSWVCFFFRRRLSFELKFWVSWMPILIWPILVKMQHVNTR